MKRKLLLVAMMLAVIACLFAVNAVAAEYVDPDTGIKYTTNSDGLTATVADSRNTFSGTEAIIKSTITIEDTEYTVTTVASNAFSNETQLTTIYFPPTITKISDSTFSGCSSMQKVYITVENLVEVGELGLTTCTSSNADTGTIKTIQFYDSGEYGKVEQQTLVTANFKNIKKIGAAAMQGFNATHLILGEELESMSKQCFRHASIQSLVMKTTKLTSFYHYSFNACLNLETIEIYSKPTIIENDYFSKCKSVKSIKIDLSDCTQIGGGAFEFSPDCQGGYTNTTTAWYNLEGENIVNLSSCSVLGYEAFGTSNVGMAEIIWPRALTSLSDQTFRKANITDFMYINAAEGVTLTIPYYALDGNAPKLVILGPGVTTVAAQFNAACTVVALADSITFTYNSNAPFKEYSTSTLYCKSATINHSSKPNIVTISSGTVSYSVTCGITADVVTENGIVTIGEATHNYIAGEYDNTKCPINNFKIYTCSKCEGTKVVSDIEGLIPKAHDHSVEHNIVYTDYTQNGLITYKCVACASTQDEAEASAPALIAYLGFSTKIENADAICIGYSINEEAIAKYQSFNSSFAYGVVAYIPVANEGPLTVADKVAAPSNPSKTIFTELENAGYSSFDFVIKGFAGHEDLALVMCAYACDGENVYYFNIDQETNNMSQSTTATTVTLEGFQNISKSEVA